MRLRLLAPSLMLALAVTAVACSSGSSSSTPAPTTPTSPPASTASASTSAATAAPSSSSTSTDATTVIKANWEAFFNAKTPAAQKIALLQNGASYAAAINAQSSSPLSSSAGARVTAVVLDSSTAATVSYDITENGASALPNQTGTAVLQDGTWKVSDASFCQLLKLEGSSAASECSS